MTRPRRAPGRRGPASRPPRRDRLRRRGLRLEYATLGWNLVGIGVLAASAVAARSVALAGFGLDSLIEIGASLLVIDQLRGGPALARRQALRLLSAAFAVLAVLLGGQAVVVLVIAWRPHHSPTGIAWTAATAVVMAMLAFAKHTTGAALADPVLVRESRVTLIDAALAVAILIGLSLNAIRGWWWADPLAGLVLVGYAAIEVAATRRDARAATAAPARAD
jgi:hypothetical protein